MNQSQLITLENRILYLAAVTKQALPINTLSGSGDQDHSTTHLDFRFLCETTKKTISELWECIQIALDGSS